MSNDKFRNRRDFLNRSYRFALPAVLLGSSGLSVFGLRRPRITTHPIRIRTAVHRKLADADLLISKLRILSERVLVATSGEVLIDVQTSLVRGIPESIFASGNAEAVVYSPALGPNRNPASLFFGGGPFGLSAKDKLAWLETEDSFALGCELYQLGGIVPVFFGLSETEFGQFSKFPIESLRSFQSLRVAASDSRAQWLQSLGSTPVVCSTRFATSQGLRSGTIDLTEALPHSKNVELDVGTDFYYLNPHHRAGAAFEVTFARQFWQSLSGDVQVLLRRELAKLGRELHADLMQVNQDSLSRLSKQGLEARHYPVDVQNYLQARCDELHESVGQLNSLSVRLRQNQLPYREHRGRQKIA